MEKASGSTHVQPGLFALFVTLYVSAFLGREHLAAVLCVYLLVMQSCENESEPLSLWLNDGIHIYNLPNTLKNQYNTTIGG